MATIQLDHISKVYEDGTLAVSELDLEIGDGEFMVLVGPSGCGKTTALRMVAGLEAVSGGVIRIDGDDVTDVPSKDRDIAMVFQNYALYPHLSVRDNMGFSLSLRKVKRSEIKTRVEDTARLLGIDQYLDRKPRQLSGGQRQRVAMGRAIVRDPQAFLMDEPLSNLDAKLRVQTRAELARLQQHLHTTTVYVTHDQTEAMTMGDRVAVLKRGVLQQVDSPDRLYDRPVNLFVGGFIGSPAMNLFEARVERGDGDADWTVRFGRHHLRLPAELATERPALGAYEGRPLVLGIRPESMEDAALAGDTDESLTIDARVDLVERTGADTYLHFVLDAPTVLTDDTRDLIEAAGSEVDRFEQSGLDTTECVARVSAHSDAREGATVKLQVDASQLQFFDVDSGLAVWDDDAGGTSAGLGPVRKELR